MRARSVAVLPALAQLLLALLPAGLLLMTAAASAEASRPSARAEEPTATRAAKVSAAEPEADPSPRSRHLLEITFGSAQLFFRQSILASAGEIDDEMVPVSAALLMAEWLLHPRVSASALFALPLETQSTVVDGQLRDEFVAPSVAMGIRASVFSLSVFHKSTMEVQVSLLGGRTLGSLSGDRFFPMVAGRVHFHTDDGFTLYLGTVYAFSEGSQGIIYGIGHRF